MPGDSTGKRDQCSGLDATGIILIWTNCIIDVIVNSWGAVLLEWRVHQNSTKSSPYSLVCAGWRYSEINVFCLQQISFAVVARSFARMNVIHSNPINNLSSKSYVLSRNYSILIDIYIPLFAFIRLLKLCKSSVTDTYEVVDGMYSDQYYPFILF